MKKAGNNQDLIRDKIYRTLRIGGIESGGLTSMTLQELATEISTYHQEVVYQNEELLRQTAELRATQEKYRELFDDAPIGYIVLDQDYKIVAANKMFAKLVLMEVAQIKTRFLTSLIHPESQHAFYIAMRELNRNGYAEIPELNLTGSFGMVRTRCSINSFVDEGEKRIRMAFLDEQEQLKMVLETIPAPVAVVRVADAIIVECNEAFEDVIGYSPAEAVGKSHRELGIYPDLTQMERMVALILRQGYCKNIEITYKAKDGHQIIGLVSARVLTLSGQPHILAIVQDITAERATASAFQKSEMRYRLLTENMKDVIWRFDPESGRYLYVSPSVQDLLGYTAEELMAKPMADHFTSESSSFISQRMADTLKELLVSKQPLDYRDEVEHIRKDGSTVWTEGIARYFINPLTGRAEITGVTRDISARKEAETKLQQSEAKYRTLLEQANQAIVVAQKGIIQYCNPHTVKLSGYDIHEVIGTSLTDFIHPQDAAMVRENFTRRMEGKAPPAAYECRILRKDGALCWAEISGIIIDWAGEAASLAFISDITDRKMREQEVQYHSYHDHLTDMYNRRYYIEALKQMDQPEQLPFSMILGDVNGLKLTNDAFGHLTGDWLLQTIAAAIKNVCRLDDTAARIGGDEFVLLLPRTSTEEAEQIVRLIQEEISRHQSGPVTVSLSIGWATKNNVAEKNSRIYMQAEDMMYSKKLTESLEMKRETLRRISARLYERSSWEEQHANRVSQWCEQMGRAMGLDARQISDIETAGRWHDIGKVSVDATGLYRQEPLSEEDKLDTVRHPEIGYNILSALPQYSEVARIVLAHHEHWDGSGYPKGLRGEEIPLASRILHVVETYDSMINGLNCDQRRSEEEAIRELQSQAGKQCDANVVSVFVEQVLPSGRQTES